MGMIEDIFEKEDEEERQYQEWLKRRRPSSSYDSSLGVCGLMLPLWLAGVVVFLWASIAGGLPWDADGAERTTFKDLVRVLYWMGAAASAAIGVLLLLGLVCRGVQRIRRDKSGAAAGDSDGRPSDP